MWWRLIKYVFNTLQQALTFALYQISDENRLRQEIYANVAEMMSFASFSMHCRCMFD
jgi:hypothetical protein